MTWHLEGLKLMSQSFSKFSRITRSFCRIPESACLSRARYMAVSSANNRCNGQFFPLGKDLTSQFFPHPVSFSPQVIFSEKA